MKLQWELFERMSSTMAEISSNNSADECPPTKKAKIQIENTSKNVNSIHETEFCSSIFNIKKILQNNCMRKQICIEGVFKGFEDSAVIILEKQNFSDDKQSMTELFNKDTVFHKLYNNDIYGNYECFPLKKFNGILAMNL